MIDKKLDKLIEKEFMNQCKIVNVQISLMNIGPFFKFVREAVSTDVPLDKAVKQGLEKFAEKI